ncbi:non-ribosomal peptide synthetase [Pseudomonas sp. SWRI22]|uniref:non-ribosomal peptide synthetase n=1 Tax=Pseudomonas sp. SWRI22 TaxID=2745513 RepID=UPI0016464D91|nr:non-ribosomal peptide synthetase [Pseudomonas sp. SWRI22]MBV4510177.1 non-ribosomal peptide synthetase [Pseudomonas sp. SWRI22]
MLFIERFMKTAASTPDIMALKDGHSNLSYHEVYNLAANLAKTISSVTSEKMIGILIPKSIDYIISVLAVHLSGKTVVTLDGDYPIERLQQMIDSIALRFCLINSTQPQELNSLIEQNAQCLCIDNLLSSVKNRDWRDPEALVDETPAYVVFTSGTTGRPKPVSVPYRSLTALVDWMLNSPPPGTTLFYAAQGFDVSFQEIYSTLCHGGCLWIISDRQKKDLHILTEQLTEKAVTRLFLPTSMLIPFVTFNLHKGGQLSSLSEVIVAGEQLKVTPAVRQWFEAHPQCCLVNHYGPSETHVVMEHRLTGRPQNWPNLPPIGRVVPGSKAFLLDEQMREVSTGSPGQLYIAGDSVALGYHNMPEQTEEKFVSHPSTLERMYETGDICVVNSQGVYEYRGRRDRQYKVRGYRVELKEIEAAVAESGMIEDCVVVAKTSGQTTSLILYYTVRANGTDVSLTLHSYLADHLPDYMLPSFYKSMPALPLNRNGKIDTSKLPEIGGLRSQLNSVYVPPQGELESHICSVAANCFGLDRMGANDNFMEVGANSITLISFLAELRYALAHDFRQTDLFEYPTPRQLCACYQRALSYSSGPLPKVSVDKHKLRSHTIRSVQSKRRG